MSLYLLPEFSGHQPAAMPGEDPSYKHPIQSLMRRHRMSTDGPWLITTGYHSGWKMLSRAPYGVVVGSYKLALKHALSMLFMYGSDGTIGSITRLRAGGLSYLQNFKKPHLMAPCPSKLAPESTQALRQQHRLTTPGPWAIFTPESLLHHSQVFAIVDGSYGLAVERALRSRPFYGLRHHPLLGEHGAIVRLSPRSFTRIGSVSTHDVQRQDALRSILGA